jgi:hypothetical protein
VKELIGHASINTTQRYAHLSQDRLAQATETVAGHYSKGTIATPMRRQKNEKPL